MHFDAPMMKRFAATINALGASAVQIIIDAIESGVFGKKQIVMEGKLVVRKSTDPEYSEQFDLD